MNGNQPAVHFSIKKYYKYSSKYKETSFKVAVTGEKLRQINQIKIV